MTPVLGPQVLSVQIGRIREHAFDGRRVRSAIAKRPVDGKVRVGKAGIEGDEQADRRYHGGPERALCAYPVEHLAAWSAEWGVELPGGSFGENLTLKGLTERDVHIGDRFRWGSVLLEVSQPREPCGNLAARLARPELPQWIRRNHWTGWYLRVLEPGEAASGLAFAREHIDHLRVTVAEAYRTRMSTRGPRDAVERLLAVQGLSSGWRVSLSKRLA